MRDLCDLGAFQSVVQHILSKYFILIGGTGTAATLQAPSYPFPTVVPRTNPNELSINDLMIVLTVLTEAMFGPLRWIHLGLSLGLLMPTLNVIGRTNGDANDHLKLTLRYWLEKKDNVTGTTWDNLIRAVRSTGDMAAAERMPGILRSKLSSIDQPNTPDTDRRQ
uniref:Death domain-containing protein n=1 Tax=Amphimedon queenslandica TaxID=400682 RepID=A0A1X7T3D7_AMPQE